MIWSRHIIAISLELRSPRYDSLDRRLRGQADAMRLNDHAAARRDKSKGNLEKEPYRMCAEFL